MRNRFSNVSQFDNLYKNSNLKSKFKFKVMPNPLTRKTEFENFIPELRQIVTISLIVRKG